MESARGIFGFLALSATLAMPAMAAENPPYDPTQELWQSADGPAAAAPETARLADRPQRRIRTLTLDHGGMATLMAGAPPERSRAARERPLVLSLPDPEGGFQRFAVQLSPVMEPELAARHPEIKTYSGRGIDSPASTIRFDLTPLGFHASVRGPQGSWYIDPSAPLDTSLYRSYFGRDIVDNPHGRLVERDGEVPEISTDRGYYHAAATVNLRGAGFAALAPIVITISATGGSFGSRTVDTVADASGAFEASFAADPDGHLGTHLVEATDATSSAAGAYDVVTDEDTSVDPPVGDQLRTYRLALLTDHCYAIYFSAPDQQSICDLNTHLKPENVTAAKVTLVNRVTHVYEAETAIRLVLIANNDVLNLNTPAQMTGANGPCGGAACFTTAQAGTCGGSTLARNRQVIGLLVGASNYDIGHIALGRNGGGVASLGVVGGNNKAQGCTGLPTPVGDFFAVDYVAHEMGHQFAGNHSFNGTLSNCSGGNRSAGNSIEPGSGSSIMAYAGICQTDNLQPHSDPYWSLRSFDEITNYTSAPETSINEVQMGVLTGFTGTDSFQLRYNGSDSARIERGCASAACHPFSVTGIQAAIQGITGWPAGGTAVATAVSDTAFTVTFNGALAATDVSLLELVDCRGCTGFVGEIAKGGLTTRRGVVTPTGNTIPVVTAPAEFTIPLRTPFALTGSATDADGDTLTYMWEQNDRGGAAGTALLSNTKTNGPLFRQFGTAAVVTAEDTLKYNSPGENAAGTNPTRVFPDLAQILANNTNAETGTCPTPPPTTPPTPPTPAIVDCFSEFLPTSAYVGFAGVNASPLSLHFRLTARDGRPGGGGVNNATTTLLLATNAGPFLVTAPNTVVTYPGASTQTVAWDVANTSAAPVNTTDVKISLSTDGGFTYPYELAAATPNDGSEAVLLPNVGTTGARVKVEAVGNVFFDVSNSDFTIQALPMVAHNAPAGTATVQYSDSLSPTLAISASDGDSPGSALVASAFGLPAGLSLAAAPFSDDATRPGTATWTVAGRVTAAPGTYDVTVTVTDDMGGTGSTTFAIVVNKEDAEAIYTGDMRAFTSPGSSTAMVLLRATVRDSSVVASFGDTEPGDITNATLSFKEGGFTLCGPLPLSLLDGTTSGTGSCSVPLWPGAHAIEVVVDNYYTGTVTISFTIQALPIVAHNAPAGGATVQYSDSLSPALAISASDADSPGSALVASAFGLPAGLSLAAAPFSDAATRPGTATWTVAGKVKAAPGTYGVTVTVTDDTGGTDSTTFAIVVNKEDAEAIYTGDMRAFTSPGSSTAMVLLRATVRDSSVVASFGDTEPGDITNATLSFKEGGFTLCGPLPLSLLDGTTSGTASCSVPLWPGAHAIEIVVDNYYTGTVTSVVEVGEPEGSHVTGVGYLVVGGSSGTHAADSGSRMGFALDVKYKVKGKDHDDDDDDDGRDGRDGRYGQDDRHGNDHKGPKAPKELTGEVDVVFRASGRAYVIKSTVIDSLGVAFKTPAGAACEGHRGTACFGLADIRSTASLLDVTNPRRPISVAGNLSLHVTVTDKGKRGHSDSIAVTLWNGNALLFSSNWTGSRTLEQALAGGRIDVR